MQKLENGSETELMRYVDEQLKELVEPLIKERDEAIAERDAAQLEMQQLSEIVSEITALLEAEMPSLYSQVRALQDEQQQNAQQ